MSKKSIAFFDFDGTLTKKDTLLEFIKYSHGGLKFWIGFLVSSPYLIAYKLKIISNQTAKEKVLSHFFARMPESTFNQLCLNFAREKIPGLIRKKGLEKIHELKQVNTHIVIVSASPENWLFPWAQDHQIELLATRLQTVDNLLTGKIDGFNCHGKEKVRRVLEKYNLQEYDTIYAYGDTSGDKPLLKLATHAYYKPFN